MVAVREVARGAIGDDTSGAMSAAFQPSLFDAEEVSFRHGMEQGAYG
ncbi:MAG TPA: hypothetical protein VF973_06885 [Myxococcales bacterium]